MSGPNCRCRPANVASPTPSAAGWWPGAGASTGDDEWRVAPSAFDRESLFQQGFAHALAKIALEFDGAVDD
jgi:hypothetical protein